MMGCKSCNIHPCDGNLHRVDWLCNFFGIFEFFFKKMCLCWMENKWWVAKICNIHVTETCTEWEAAQYPPKTNKGRMKIHQKPIRGEWKYQKYQKPIKGRVKISRQKANTRKYWFMSQSLTERIPSKWDMCSFLAALAALYLTLVSDWLSATLEFWHKLWLLRLEPHQTFDRSDELRRKKLTSF